MVSLVLVSHVYEIAMGTKLLAQQMAGDDVKIEAVGGLPGEGKREETTTTPSLFPIGTDAVQIADTIQRCWSAEGVLLLVDLGSAVLSAELALDLLPAEISERCLISNAPLVEGAVMAAVEASLGHSLEAVNAAAEGITAIAKVQR